MTPPPEGSWKRAAPRPSRSAPSCALVDGRVVYLRSQGSHRPTEAWLYDPTLDTYLEIPAPPTHSWEPCAIGTAEGWLALLGGRVDQTQTSLCCLYEPATNTWHDMPAMPEPRDYPALVLAGGRIFVISGRRANDASERNVWSWAPGEEWRRHPDLPSMVGLRGVSARGRGDGSLVVWSPGALAGFAGQRWEILGTVGEGVEMFPSEDGLLAIGGTNADQTHARVQRWSHAGWEPQPTLSRPRCSADARRLADGRLVVLAGRRHAYVLEDSSTGGELDIEYRSFTQVQVHRLVDCEDLELKTDAGWVSLATPIPFGSSCVTCALRDGRLLVAQRYTYGVYSDPPTTYLWTPPASNA